MRILELLVGLLMGTICGGRPKKPVFIDYNRDSVYGLIQSLRKRDWPGVKMTENWFLSVWTLALHIVHAFVSRTGATPHVERDGRSPRPTGKRLFQAGPFFKQDPFSSRALFQAAIHRRDTGKRLFQAGPFPSPVPQPRDISYGFVSLSDYAYIL